MATSILGLNSINPYDLNKQMESIFDTSKYFSKIQQPLKQTDKLNPNDVQQNTKGVDLYQSYLQHQKDQQKLMGMDPVKFDGYNKPTIPEHQKTPPPDDKNKKGLTATQSANIISGIAGLASAGLGIYGAMRASKDKPFVASYRAPVEPELVKDRTSAIKASTEESITKSVNTARAQQRSLGMSDYGALVGKETEALNQLAGQLAQYRTGIDAQNVQMINQMKMYNDQAERQRDLQNASLMNQFKQYTGQMLSAAYSGVGDSILGSANAIMQNVNYAQTKKEATEAQDRQEKLNILLSLANSPDLPTRTSAIAKLNSLYNLR